MPVGKPDELETGSKPAPGDLALIQAFVNTGAFESGGGAMDDAARLGEWLSRRGLMRKGASVSAADLKSALELREAFRALLMANAGGELDRAHAKTLTRVAERSPLAVRADDSGGLTLVSAADGVAGALGKLLAIAMAATVEGTWGRLKACRSDACRWVFYDSSKNRSGAWCDMAVCGSRTKARAYRQRKAAKKPSRKGTAGP